MREPRTSIVIGGSRVELPYSKAPTVGLLNIADGHGLSGGPDEGEEWFDLEFRRRWAAMIVAERRGSFFGT